MQATPELSQRLFGSTTSTSSAATTKLSTTAAITTINLTSTNKQQDISISNKSIPANSINSINDSNGGTTSAAAAAAAAAAMQHLPTILGLKIRAINNTNQQQQQQQQHTSNNNLSDSLMKQQIRNEHNSATNVDKQQQTMNSSSNIDISNCCALQSLANVANERQLHTQTQTQTQGSATNIQPPNASNLHHQFLLHMAANPMLKPVANAVDYYQLQQQQQQQQQQQHEDIVDIDSVLLEPLDKSENEHELTLADENAGLEYQQGAICESENNSLTTQQTATSKSVETKTLATSAAITATTTTSRPVQRRRIRRKAQSSIDDQAEHLTEMSVRGLDLFRYASISEGVYQCTECAKENMQKTFKNKYSFQRHAFLYHEGKHRKVFPCPVCSKEFSRPDKMKNHMKMTHESFNVPKDVNNYNPLNYLINAAATSAGSDIHATLFQQQQQQQHLQQQQANEAALATLQQQREQQQQQEQLDNNTANNMLTLENFKQESELNEPYVENTAATTEAETAAATAPTDSASPKSENVVYNIQNDIIIKNEIVISPTPSPPPLSTCSGGSGNNSNSSLGLVSAQTAT